MEEKLTYEQVDEIVQGYKKRIDGYSQKLVDAFEGFLHQYISLLKYGTIDVKKEKLRKFLALFVAKDLSERFYQWKHNPNIKKAIYIKALQLSGLFSRFTEEEIRHVAIYTLLEMANLYNRINKPVFCAFLDRMFCIYFKNNVESIVKDPLIRNCWLQYDDGIHCTYTINYNKIVHNVDQETRVSRSSIPTVEDNGDFNFNWINGVTPDGPFRMLHPIDREILVLYYINGMTDGEIAERLNFKARETVNRRRHKAEERVGQYAKEHNMLRLWEGVQLYNEETASLRRVCGES